MFQYVTTIINSALPLHYLNASYTNGLFQKNDIVKSGWSIVCKYLYVMSGQTL